MREPPAHHIPPKISISGGPRFRLRDLWSHYDFGVSIASPLKCTKLGRSVKCNAFGWGKTVGNWHDPGKNRPGKSVDCPWIKARLRLKGPQLHAQHVDHYVRRPYRWPCFPTHIKCSTLVGIGGGIAASMSATACRRQPMPAVGRRTLLHRGILPDIDSGPGIPLREITTFLASVVPTMLITRLLAYRFTQESLILTGAIIYVGIRFGLSHFLRHYTIHRGMFHSFPSMAIFGELTYLLFYGESPFVRIFMVSSVCLGFFIHLLLDEIYSVEWDGKPRLKKSFGTAMKFVGNGWWPNFACVMPNWRC